MRDWGREKAGEPSLWWPVIGRNKKSVTLDLRQNEGQELLRELVAKSDFLLENFRPGTLEHWNLGREQLRRVNPSLIMVRVSGYGQTGPYAARAGFGAIGEAMGGLRYVVGDPSTPPSRIGISIGDSLAATFACVGALSALHHRERNGRGQVVDSAIYEAVLGMMESLLTEYDQTSYIRERTGAILPTSRRRTFIPPQDGLVLIAANQDTVFSRLCEAMGNPAARRRSALRDPPVARRAPAGARRADRATGRSTQTTARGARADGEARRAGRADLPRAGDARGSAFRGARGDRPRAAPAVRHDPACRTSFRNFQRRPDGIRSPSPALGEHNDAIYLDFLGLPPDRYAALKAARVI